jgi:hypothetical protein
MAKRKDINWHDIVNLVLVFALMAVGAVFLITLYELSKINTFSVPSMRHRIHYGNLITLSEFNGLSSWIQAVVGLGILAVAIIGARQIHFMKVDAERKKHDWEREIYRRLIAPEIAAARKLINIPAGRQILESAKVELGALEVSAEVSKGKYQALLDEIRSKFDELGKSQYWPLTATGKAGFDNIDFMLSEYNYICKLFEEKLPLEENFATEQALHNFINMYEALEAVIKVRQQLSLFQNEEVEKIGRKSYASHYVAYCKEKSRKEM